MLSLLGVHFDIKGYIFKPLYLLLGVFYFMVLLSLLGILYVILYIRDTLEKMVNNIQKERNKWFNSR